MKLRIRGNSIRIRLMQGEVRQLETVGLVDEIVDFPGGTTFTYSLKIASKFTATFLENHLQISIAKEDAQAWIESNEDISLSRSLILSNGEFLKVLVEKDLSCLTSRDGEDDSDAFPNPKNEC